MAEHQFAGHVFASPTLLQQALTHRSAARRNNERLEFLGDALLNCVIAEMLYAQFTKSEEGALTRLRARLVNQDALAEVARSLALGDRIELGTGELRSGGHRRASILSDALEACIAAVYLDAGWEPCRRVIADLFTSRMQALPSEPELKDPKTRLQEWLQARGLPLPEYQLVRSEGDDHAKRFWVQCVLADPAEAATSEGASRRGAEQAAAASVLERIMR